MAHLDKKFGLNWWEMESRAHLRSAAGPNYSIALKAWWTSRSVRNFGRASAAMGLCVGRLMVRYPLQEQAQALASGCWGVVGEIVRRERRSAAVIP